MGSQVLGSLQATHGATAGGAAAPTWGPSVGSDGRSGPISVHLHPGTIVGGSFRVEGALGAGGMGVVYQATHLKLDRPVALKLHPAGDLDAARLEREARAMARLSHPNVIGVFDVGTWVDQVGEAHVFIAMEYCDAGTLRGFIASRPDWRRALDTCRQAAEGLAAAHAAGLVHRDFKPDNVLLSSDGRVRVADFGLARGHGLAADPHTSSTITGGTSAAMLAPSDQLTRTGALVGTPAYMAPEQFGGGLVDARADQFAFCVVAYEALWGKRPFQGATAGELLYNITMRGPTMPPRGDLPPRIWEVLRRGLDPNPTKRFATMRALIGELDRARKATGPAAGTLALALGVPVLVIAGGAGIWWMTRDSGATTTARTEAHAPIVVVAEPDASEDASEDADDGEEPLALEHAPTHALELPPEDDPEAPEVDPDEARWRAVEELGDANFLEDPLAAAKAFEEAQEQGAGDLALMFGVMQGMANSADELAPDDDIGTAWNGTSTLVCGNGTFAIEGKTIEVTSGPAFQVSWGCKLSIVDCTITAPIVVQGTNAARVEIVGTSITATDGVLDLLNPGHVEIRETSMTQATKGPAVKITNGSPTIVDSELRGEPAIDLLNAETARVEGGALVGTTAIKCRNCELRLAEVEVDGTIERGANAVVVEVVREDDGDEPKH
jgi:hypothetical protein